MRPVTRAAPARSSRPVPLLFAVLAVAALAVGVALGAVSTTGPGSGTPTPGPLAVALASDGSGSAASAGIGPSGEPTRLPVGSAGPSGSKASAAAASLPSAPRASASAAPRPTPTASPTSTLQPPPAAGPFAMDLYRKGDYVEEVTKVMCVPAAMQTMINILTPGADTTSKTQYSLYALARKLSPKTLKGDGAEPEGWARGLTQLGHGPYAVGVQPTRVAAIHEAARVLRLTGKPVGILAWRGAHSWVMSGFKATADPAFTTNFRVTDVYIEDVWWPRVSSIWGPSRKPDSLVPVSLLGEDILPWRRPTGAYPGKDGKYVLVLPVVPAA